MRQFGPLLRRFVPLISLVEMKLIVRVDCSSVRDSEVQLGIFRDRHVFLGLDVT